MTSAATAREVEELPQDKVPSLIWITFTIDSMRKTQPITDPRADPSIPNLITLRLM